MIRTQIRKGSTILTPEGQLVITSRNDAGLFYCNEYIISEAGEMVLDGERRLTMAELEKTAKDFDGQVHKFMWIE